MKTLKILGCLLTYPNTQMVAALPEFRQLLEKEKWLSEESLQPLDRLMEWMTDQDILDLQEEFVALFDRTPSLCLHLFEHVHGDSRDRGQALADLSGVYKDAGLLICTEEMPDFLPLFLEYLSVLEVSEAAQNLGEIANVLGVLSGRLRNRQSPYVAVLDALVAAALKKPDEKAVAAALKEAAGAASTLTELDESWEEQNAFENSLQTTGVGADAGCPNINNTNNTSNTPGRINLLSTEVTSGSADKKEMRR